MDKIHSKMKAPPWLKDQEDSDLTVEKLDNVHFESGTRKGHLSLLPTPLTSNCSGSRQRADVFPIARKAGRIKW